MQRDAGDGRGASERPGQAGPSQSPVPETALTRGFLFCDLRGYTAFVEERGDRAAVELLAAFRTIVREAIAATRGGEVRTEGDSFYVVFPSASAAVRCGLAITDAAASTNAEQPDRLIRVGVGIHAGESIEHREGFVGSAVNIAARVCALASAGEVLVTDTVRSLVRTSLDVTFVARGRRHLKGISEPIALYAVTSAPSFANGKARGWPLALGPRVARRRLLLGAILTLGVVAVALGVSMLGGGAGLPAPLPGQLVFLASAREQQVYLALPNGDERRRLTPLSENVSQFVVRPDTGAIAYVAGDQIRIASLSDAGGSSRWPGTWGLPDFYQGSALVDIDLIAWLPSGELLLEEGRPDRVKACWPPVGSQ
ncbi:MAG: adenylate/guanylate cyclase domain-containing protein [Chloroflexota bacterium]